MLKPKNELKWPVLAQKRFSGPEKSASDQNTKF